MAFEKIDSKNIPLDPSEICLFVATRNNEIIMPAFFKHYRGLGVDRFFVIDNMSTDGTVKFLLKQKSTHVFSTDEPYRKQGAGQKNNWNRWANRLKKYVIGNWCVVADSDEFLIYPHCETHSLKEFTAYLDKEGSTAIRGRLMDMYSKYPVKDTIYKKGQDIFEVLPYFDYPCRRVKSPRVRAMKRIKGGGRGKALVRLNKCPLFKCSPSTVIKSGHHTVGKVRISPTASAAVLHFKYTSDYLFHLTVESSRGVYYNNALIKRQMLKVFRKNPNFSFFFARSKKYQDSKQLLDLGFARMEGEYEH